MVHLRTLGRFELVAGEAPSSHVVSVQPKRLALLAYLAIAAPAGAHRRDSLLALFWPELDTDDSRRALRQALYALRQFLDGGALESRRDDQVALTGDRAWCDVVAFERALETRQLEEALALYQGPFLDGVFVSDVSADFEQWVGNTRNRLCANAMRAAGTLADQAHTHGDLTSAIKWATVACRLAPDDESSARRLMRALADADDRPQALRVFAEFQLRLLNELGATPASDTLSLAASLRAPSPAPGVQIDARRVLAPPVAADAELADATPSARLPLLPISPASPHASELDAPSPATTPSTIVHATKNTRRWPVAAGIAAALLLLTGWFVSQESGRGAPADTDRVLIADFRNTTHDTLLAIAVTEALRADFSQSRRTHVLSLGQVQAALLRMQQPSGALFTDVVARELAEREGIKAFVTGEVAALGNGFSVSATLISSQRGDVLSAVREVASDSTQLIAAVDRVSTRLRRSTGESLWAVRTSPSLERVTTSSLQALRMYSQAVRLGDQEGRRGDAIPLLQQAVARDTTFAMAYRKLGAYLGGERAQTEADNALQHAFRYRDRLPEVERYLTIGAYFDNGGLPDSALVAYRTLLQFDPMNTVALNNTAAQYVTLRNFRMAEQFRRRALESDSGMSVLYTNLANDQFNSGKLDDVERTLAAHARRFPPEIDAEVLAISLKMARGHYTAAESLTRDLLSAAKTDVADQLTPLRMLGLELLVTGRLAEAEQVMTRYMDGQARAQSSGAYLEGALLLAFVQQVYRHDATRSLQIIDSALARFPLQGIPALDRHYAFLAYVLALNGKPARSRVLLAALRATDSATHGGAADRNDGDYLRAQGAVLLAEHRYGEAILTLVRSGTAMNLYVCPVCALPDLARAYDLAGQPDSAIAVYERYVTTPWTDWMYSDGEYRSIAWQRLGELYESKRDTTRAIRAFRNVADLWAHADATVQPDLASVRASLTRLRATR